ncbi:WD40 repeat domain-containing protein [Kitasatospora sp. NBC_00374]|uniref:WD40 repeat domain-containing protein n=1 Tax=Kitasatospora sp. NBC_00374 TaxID=2975964 RepID=UPI00352D5F3B
MRSGVLRAVLLSAGRRPAAGSSPVSGGSGRQGGGPGAAAGGTPRTGTGPAAGPVAATVCTIWDKATGRQTAHLTGHTSSVQAVAVAPDGTRLATTGDNRTVRIWDPASEQALTTMRTESILTTSAWTPDSLGLVVGGERGVYFYEVRPSGAGSTPGQPTTAAPGT